MSTYYATPTAPNRRRNRLSRTEYQSRRTEFAARGQELPQAKLLDMDVIDIRSAHRQRLKLLQYIRENLSNEAIAKRHGISLRAVEEIVSRRAWCHVA